MTQMLPVRPQPALQCTSTGSVSLAWQSRTSRTISSSGLTLVLQPSFTFFDQPLALGG